MKWWITVLCVCTLAGCSSPMKSVTDYIDPSSTETLREQIEENVHIYSLEQNVKAVIISWDERDKWAIAPASAVIHHPKALVETSNGQLLEGTVTTIDVGQNIAVIHFRNSAVLANKTIEIDSLANDYQTIDEDGQYRALSPDFLATLVNNLSKEEVPFEERQTAREQLKIYPEIVQLKENKIENYEKETFAFDRDALQQQVHVFAESYNAFINQQGEQLIHLIANDALKEMFQNWKFFGDEYTFHNIKVERLQYEGYLYKASFSAEMGKKDPKKVNVQLIYTRDNEAFKLVTFSIN